MEYSNLIIQRPDQDTFKMKRIQVYIDDEKVCDITNEETKTIRIPAGMHSIYAKVGWMKSPAVILAIGAGEDMKFNLLVPVPKGREKYIFGFGFMLMMIGNFLSRYFNNDLFF